VLSPSREVLDLIATSPVAAEATAVALQNGSVLSAASFSELTASHPWSSRRPDDVLLELQRIPALAHVLSELNPRRQRELLSGIGQAMEPVLISMEQRLLRVSVESFSRFSGVVESEFVFFCKACLTLLRLIEDLGSRRRTCSTVTSVRIYESYFVVLSAPKARIVISLDNLHRSSCARLGLFCCSWASCEVSVSVGLRSK
jgi:hypothetical protein